MDFQHSEHAAALRQRIDDFMDGRVFPVEHLYREQVHASGDPRTRFRTPPVLQQLKAVAREQGLWNLFLPGSHGAGLSNLEYAPLAESMGRVLWASEVFNCSAPDTGNMEVLAQYGTPEQQAQWLEPLLEGRIRSAFSMTEPEVASSDATNIRCSIRRESSSSGDVYVIDGRKWYTSGALNEDCKLLIVMGLTNPEHADVHKRQSMILVPKATPGVRIVRDMNVFGYDDAPVGHPEIVYDSVRVPVTNMLLGRGPRFRDCAGPPGARAHPPLHAADRLRAARARADVPPRHAARGLRPPAGRAWFGARGRRPFVQRHRAGAAADAARRRQDGPRRQQGGAGPDRRGEDRGAERWPRASSAGRCRSYGGAGVSAGHVPGRVPMPTRASCAWAMVRTRCTCRRWARR